MTENSSGTIARPLRTPSINVTFDAARDVFKDPFAVEQLDDRENYGEDRYATAVMAGLVPVIHAVELQRSSNK